jgi:signal transduction histidine kinase/ActR/RegA family two-component response regulator
MFVLALAVAAAGAAAEPAEARPRGRVIRVGVVTDSFPYSYRVSDGKVDGFAWDVTQAVMEAMALRFRRVTGTTEEVRAAFNAGEVDLLQNYAQIPEREDGALFSVPYLTLTGAIIVREGERGIQSLDDLRSRKVLVHRNSVGDALLRRAGLQQSIVYVESVRDSLRRLAAGEGDATLASRLSTLALLEREDIEGLRVLDANVPGFDLRFCLAVRKGDTELLAQVNEGLAIVMRTGRFDEIYDKWFGHLEPAHYSATQVLAAIAVGLAIALAVAIFAAMKQRHLRRRLQLQEEQLRQKQKIEAVGTLARGVAHDFNNLLTAIMGNVELSLLGLPPDHPEAPGLKLALKAAQRARDLVKQILVFSRQTEPKREVVALGPMIDETVNLLRTLAKDPVAFEVQVAADVPPVSADPAQLHQVLMNLGANAVQAMRGQSGRLGFTVESVTTGRELHDQQVQLNPGHYVRVAVQDTGPGMTDEVRRRVFEPFFTTKGPGEGSGLGLSVVHGIMQQHGGAVTLYTHPGRGSRFDLYFPVAPAATAPAPAAVNSAGRGERILLVDDDTAVVDTGRKIFERLGYRVSAHTRAERALEEYRREPAAFDLVFSDLTMPGMNGLQLLEAVRAVRTNQPFILCSGIFSESDRQAASSYGVSVLLPKPLAIDTIGTAVKSALNGSRAGGDRDGR